MKINFNELFKKLGKWTSIPFIIGFLGALGGSKNSSKSIRRFGIPAIILILAFMKAIYLFPKNIIFIFLMFESLILSIGYGIPDDDYPVNIKADSGSKLGRFYTMIFRKKLSIKNAHILGDIFSRSTIGFLFCIPLYVIPYLFHNWISYLIGCFIILFSYSTISWRPLGTIKLGDYELCNADNIHYGLIGYAIYIIIFTCYGG